jgi:hypothetical protein
MGDMNNIMHVSEKLGPCRPDVRHINALCDHVKQCGFIDLGYSGLAYTWSNKRSSIAPTFQRLDRCFANAECCATHPGTTVYHLPMLHSDHAPILTILNSSRTRTNKPFHFENWWLMEQDYGTGLSNGGPTELESLGFQAFCPKIKYLAFDLRKWQKTKPKLSDQLATIEDQLLQQQSKPPHEQDFDLQNHLTHQHHQLLAKDEQFHLQRAKKNWALHGARNTTYFHQSITKRTRKNRISYLQNPDGSYSTTPDHLALTITNYFRNIFSLQVSGDHHTTATEQLNAHVANRADA